MDRGRIWSSLKIELWNWRGTEVHLAQSQGFTGYIMPGFPWRKSSIVLIVTMIFWENAQCWCFNLGRDRALEYIRVLPYLVYSVFPNIVFDVGKYANSLLWL